MGCFIVLLFFDSWSFYLLSPSTLTVWVPFHDDYHLIGFFGTLLFWLDHFLYEFIINVYFMVLLIKTFG